MNHGYRISRSFSIGIVLVLMALLILDPCFANTTLTSSSGLTGNASQISFTSSPQFNMEFTYLTSNAGGYVTKNSEIRTNIPKTNLSSKIFEMVKKGPVVVKAGNGGGPKLLICAGIHGNEEESSIAVMKYLEFIKDRKFNGTLYIIPFALPKSTEKNSRYYRGRDPNRLANYPGTPGYKIVQFALKNRIKYLLDVHSGSGVGRKGLIFYRNPCYPAEKSWLNSIKTKTGCNVLANTRRGAIRTVAHKAGINAITIEVERVCIPTSSAAAGEYMMILAACKFLGFPG